MKWSTIGSTPVANIAKRLDAMDCTEKNASQFWIAADSTAAGL